MFRLHNSCRTFLNSNINVSYECIHSYAVDCKDNPDCNEECQEMILEIGNFSITGLYKLQAELCDPDSVMRRSKFKSHIHTNLYINKTFLKKKNLLILLMQYISVPVRERLHEST